MVKGAGGSGGGDFADRTTDRTLKRIKIRSGSRLDGIQCIYDDDSTTDWHGGGGGREDIFALNKDEAIVVCLPDAASFESYNHD
jgi:hypothetical protein